MLEGGQQADAQLPSRVAQPQPQAGHLQVQRAGATHRRRGPLVAVEQLREVLAGEVGLSRWHGGMPRHASGCWPRPASCVDLVDRVEQEIVLHVVVALQARRLERRLLVRSR